MTLNNVQKAYVYLLKVYTVKSKPMFLKVGRSSWPLARIKQHLKYLPFKGDAAYISKKCHASRLEISIIKQLKGAGFWVNGEWFKYSKGCEEMAIEMIKQGEVIK